MMNLDGIFEESAWQRYLSKRFGPYSQAKPAKPEIKKRNGQANTASL
jgi:hypothetical protein